MALAMCLCASGQTTPQRPTFEVASIKPSKPGATSTSIRWDPNGRFFTASNVPVKTLIQFAYGIRGGQLSGGPKWLDSKFYDIVANTDAVPTGTSQQKMDANKLRLQVLLADRFHLRLRREMVQRSGYALVPSKNGSRLSEAAKNLPGTKAKQGSIMTMQMLASFLQSESGRPVADKTGLQGSYYVILTWTSDNGVPRALGTGVPPTALNSPDVARPSLFTALQEQLGLRLQDQKLPVETYVIESIESPTEN
jgi:uncharacterized protein (TIGR03435 family)